MKEKGILVLGYKNMSDKSTYEIEKDLEDGWVKEIKMKYSELDGRWLSPGGFAAKLEDTGNGFLIYFKDRSIQLDYDQAQELGALLKMEDAEACTFSYFKEQK